MNLIRGGLNEMMREFSVCTLTAGRVLSDGNVRCLHTLLMATDWLEGGHDCRATSSAIALCNVSPPGGSFVTFKLLRRPGALNSNFLGTKCYYNDSECALYICTCIW